MRTRFLKKLIGSQDFPQRLKPHIEKEAVAARLKSCPDTSCPPVGILWQAVAPAFVAALLLPLCLGLAGCRSLPPSKPAFEWTAQEARGAAVFQNKCARCHYPTTTSGLNGPGLQAITKVKAMPSGAPPTDERIASTILHGRGMMPATPLDDRQLDDLLAYLHTL